MSTIREVELEGGPVRLTNLDRVLWPRTGFTKGQMLEYYLAAAPALLPGIANRPITLGRWPKGVERAGFAQTECRGHPEWIRTMPLRLRSGQVRNYCVVDDVRSLAWVANLGTVELHIYPFRFERPDQPDAAVFDLDPGPGAGLLDACRVGLLVREMVAARGLSAHPKTSGSAGIHVRVPLGEPRQGDQVRELARGLARALASAHDDLITADPHADRQGRVLIDWLASDPRRSTVAAYSLRATPMPSVSTPVGWGELEEALTGERADALSFGPAEVLNRLGEGSGACRLPGLPAG